MSSSHYIDYFDSLFQVYVVDSSDEERLDETVQEFNNLLVEEELTGMNYIVLIHLDFELNQLL